MAIEDKSNRLIIIQEENIIIEKDVNIEIEIKRTKIKWIKNKITEKNV